MTTAQKTYRVHAEMIVRGHVKVLAKNKNEAAEKVRDLLESETKHQAIDTIQIGEGDFRRHNEEIHFYIPTSYIEIDKGI